MRIRRRGKLNLALRYTYSLSGSQCEKMSYPYIAAPHTITVVNTSDNGTVFFVWVVLVLLVVKLMYRQSRHHKQLYQKNSEDSRIWCWSRKEQVGATMVLRFSLMEIQFCSSLIQSITVKQNPAWNRSGARVVSLNALQLLR